MLISELEGSPVKERGAGHTADCATLRIPVALLSIIGGIFAFLPVLGI